MDFQRMKRAELQSLCKKHGIPANLKNSEMATRLAEVRANRFSRNSSGIGSCKDPIVVVVSVVKSSKKVANKKMKRDRSAEPEMDIEEYSRFEQEGSSKKKSKTVVNQEDCVTDNPQGMAEDSPSSSEVKATEPVMVSENVLDSTVKVSSVRKTQECDSQLVEGEHVEESEQETVLMAATMDEEEASTLSVSITECSEVSSNRSAAGYLSVEATPPPPSLQLAKSNPEAELCIPIEPKEHSSVSNLAKVEVTLQNKAEIHSNKDDEKGSLEKDLQAANSYGNFFDEHSIAEEEMEISKVGFMSVGPCENQTPQKLVDAYTQLEAEQVWASNVEARGSSKKMKTVNQEFEKEKPQGIMALDSPSASETKATEPVMISEYELDSTPKLSVVRNIQESNSELMEEEPEERQEQDTVLMVETKKNKEESSSLSVFLVERSEVSNPEAELFLETTPPSASVHLAVSNPEAELGVPTGHILVKDIASTVVPEGIFDSISRSELKEHSFVAKLAEAEAIMENSAECRNVIHASNVLDESFVFTTPERKLMFMEQLSENGKILAAQSVTHHNDEAVESHALVFTTPEKVLLQDEAEKEEDHTATKFPDVLNATEKKCFMLGGSRKTEARNEGESTVVKLPDESNITTSPVRQFSGEDFKRDGIERNEENRTVEFSCDFGTCTIPDRRIVLGNLVSDGAEDSGGINRADKSGLLTSLEKQLFYEQKEAVKTEEKAAAEFQHESAVPNTPERQSILQDSQLNEEMKKGDYVIGKSHVVSDDFTAAESQSVMGDSEPDEAENKHRENTDVESSSESNIFTNLEKHLSFDIGKSGLSHHASSSKVVLKENSVVWGSHVAALEFTENTITDSNDVIGLEAIQGTKQSKRDSVDLFAFDIQEGETITETEINVFLSSYVLALPAKDNSCEELRLEDISETIGEVSSHLELSGTYSMVSGESGPSTDIQNHLNDALEELAMKGNNEADNLMEAKESKHTHIGFEGNLLLDSSGNSFVSEKTCIIVGADDEHFVFDSEVDSRNACEKSSRKSLENEATGPLASEDEHFEEAISLTPDESTVQNNTNEEAADEEVIRRETTPSSEETMNELSEKQVRREPLLIYGTQVKPNGNNMKENAPNSKIMHNLNITAPRISKRKPLQDLKKN